MTKKPLKPRRRNRQMTVANNRPGTLFNLDIPEPVTLSDSQAIPVENTVVKPIVAGENIELQKFAQLILYGISLAAIWGGILSIAFFSESTSNENFLVLGFGGIISACMAIALVEWQRRRGGKEVHSIHGYIMGVGFFFSAVGVLYTARLLISIAAENGVSFLVDEGRPWQEEDWQPAAEAIYVQLAACLLLALGQYWYMRKLKGEITFGLAVNTLTPLAVLMIGFGPWLEWSNQVVSYELGISIISLSALSMWLALRTNNGIIFSIVAVFSGLVPILYEFAHSPDVVGGEGGALSLMTFIILVQGALAADDRLRQDLMQWTSIFLVGVVIYAIWLVGYRDLNLVLGPLRAENLGDLEEVLNLQVVLWITVLIAYFPATLKRRIPYMPIGLAGSLFLFTPASSMVPWIIATAMLPYLIIISKVTRRWVADWSIIAISTAFLLQSYFNPIATKYEFFEEIILLSILVIIEYSRRNDRLSDFAINSAILGLFLSKAVLYGTSWLIPWAVVFYILVTAYFLQQDAVNSKEDKKFITASLTILLAMVVTVILSSFDRLGLPMLDDYQNVLDGFNVSLAIVSLTVYLVMFKFRDSELDLGYLFALSQSRGQKLMPVYDQETKQWINPFEQVPVEIQGYGPLARSSLLGPLALIMISISFIDIESLLIDVHWIGVIIIPIAILLREVLMEEKNTSVSRAIAVWATVIIALPIALKFLFQTNYQTEELQINTLLFDLILLSGPIIVSLMLRKDKMDKNELNETADDLTLYGLLALGLLDASGGFLFLTMYTLVICRGIIHKRVVVLCAAPFSILLFADRFVSDGSHIKPLIDYTILNMNLVEVNSLNVAIFSSMILSLSMLAIIIKSMLENKKIIDLDEIEIQLPFTVPFIWLTIGLFGMLPDVAWLPTAMILLITIFAWVSGRLESVPLLIPSMFAALAIGFNNDISDGGDYQSGELWNIISNSALYGAIYSLVLNQMARTGVLYRYFTSSENSTDGDEEFIEHYFVLRNTDTSKEMFQQYSKGFTITGFLFSFTALAGIGPIIGALYLTYTTISDRYKNLFVLLPIIHILSFINFAMRNTDLISETAFYQLSGLILIAEGLFFTYYSSKAEYGWEMFDWEEEDEFYTWLDNLGIISMAYVIAGFAFAMQRVDADELLWALVAIYLSGVGLQGFREETEAPWRRGFGSFGAIIALFLLSLSIDTEIFRYMTWMFIGIVAFGFGILYMNRLGEVSNLYETENLANLPAMDSDNELIISDTDSEE